MKPLPHSGVQSAILVLACAAAMGSARASPVTLTQELYFDMFRVNVLDTVGQNSQAVLSGVGDSTSPFGFMPFYSSYGTLLGAHWEIDTVYGIRLESTLDSLSTNPNEVVYSGNVYAGMSFSTNVLQGTGGQHFLAVAEINTGCHTTAASGSCAWVSEKTIHLQESIAAIDLSPFLAGDVIVQQMSMGATLGHYPGEGPIDLSTWAEFGSNGPEYGAGKIRLVYDYDDGTPAVSVPEPGSLALVLAGLAALWRRRAALRCRAWG